MESTKPGGRVDPDGDTGTNDCQPDNGIAFSSRTQAIRVFTFTDQEKESPKHFR